MSAIEKKLQELGLSYREAKVYRAALELGRFGVTELSDRSGVKRPTCYVIMDELVRRGLVAINPQYKKLPYTVEPPSQLIRQVEEKAVLARLLSPDLEALYSSASEKPLIRFYSGRSGMERVSDDILKSGVKDVWSVWPAESYVKAIGEDYFYHHWTPQRIKRGIFLHTICIGNVDRKAFPATPEFLREFKYAPASINIPYTVALYATKVGFISSARDGFGLIIESKDFHQTIKGFFDALWQISK